MLSEEDTVREVLELGRCRFGIEVRVCCQSGGNVSIWYAKDYSTSLSTSLLDSSSPCARLAQSKLSLSVNQCRDLELDLPVIALWQSAALGALVAQAHFFGLSRSRHLSDLA